MGFVQNFFMYQFNDYKCLSRATRALATRYWLACLKSHLDVTSTYKIAEVLSSHTSVENRPLSWSNSSTRFFNMKENGQPVIRVNTLENIDKLLGGSFNSVAILCHPLWQLIDKKQPTKNFIDEVLSNLPLRYVSVMFHEDEYGGLTRKVTVHARTLDKMQREVNIHNMTFWLAACIENIHAEGNISFFRAESQYRYQIFELGRSNPLKAIAACLEKHIASLIKK